MEKQFNLILTNRWKATVLVLGIVIVTLPMLLGILAVFERSKLLGSLLGVIGLVAFVMLPERIAKHFSAEHATVIFNATEITVSYAATGEVRRLEFAAIVSYYAGLEFDFTIRPRQGQALVFHLNRKLHPQGIGPLVQMQQYFQQAIAGYQLRQPTDAPIIRQHFFDRGWSTFWLVFFATMLVWRSWWMAQQQTATEGQWGGLIFGSLLWGGYALAWFHYRRKA